MYIYICSFQDVAHFLARKGYKHVNAKDNAGYTPLHISCMYGHLTIAKCLIVHGALVSICQNNHVK